MKSLDLTQLGGFPLTQDNLDWLQQAYNEGLSGVTSIFGSNYLILSGMNYTGELVEGTTVISSGWAFINGQIVEFPESTYQGDGMKLQNVTTTIVMENGTSFQSKQKIVLTWATGLPPFHFSDLKRLNPGWQSVEDISFGTGTIEYKINQLANECRVRGSINRTGISGLTPPYIFYAIATLPVTPSTTAVGWASIRLHGGSTPVDTEGNPLWGDRVEIQPDGILSMRWRGLASGSYGLDFDFTFSLD